MSNAFIYDSYRGRKVIGETVRTLASFQREGNLLYSATEYDDLDYIVEGNYYRVDDDQTELACSLERAWDPLVFRRTGTTVPVKTD